ncbi:MAG TPA: hypothetical protein VFE22_14820 [Edaphobacter sp.]|jgi:hypothetical protein|nr:hypothetical protein [Edaphobacter sp.]
MKIITTTFSRALRNLYFTRTLFQFIWAFGVILTAPTQPQVAAILLILYPLWDVAGTSYDIKTTGQAGLTRTSQIINAALGVATALGIALTVFNQPAYAIAIFGGWALAAGLLQLLVGLIRRSQLGGQWAMILSGGQSMAAGIGFVLGGLSGKFHIKDLSGYAVFGAIYFLAGAILLSRKLSRIGSVEKGAGVAA